MTAGEQLWFSVGIAGFVIFLDASIILCFNEINKSLFQGKIPEQFGRVGGGLIILVIAIIYLFNLPSAN